MPFEQFYFYSLEAHDCLLFTKEFGWCYQELIKDLIIIYNVTKRGQNFVDW